MKSLFVVLALSLCSSAFARQYIQCTTLGDSTDVAVVNLPTEKAGSLFLSSGMQNSEADRILFKIELDKIEKNLHVFKIVSENGEGSVTVPSEVIGKAINGFTISVDLSGGSMDYGCFSAIYND